MGTLVWKDRDLDGQSTGGGQGLKQSKVLFGKAVLQASCMSGSACSDPKQEADVHTWTLREHSLEGGKSRLHTWIFLRSWQPIFPWPNQTKAKDQEASDAIVKDQLLEAWRRAEEEESEVVSKSL